MTELPNHEDQAAVILEGLKIDKVSKEVIPQDAPDSRSEERRYVEVFALRFGGLPVAFSPGYTLEESGVDPNLRSGFHSALVINETYTQLPATSVGATVADGAVGAFSFTGNPYRIKVVATGVTGATEANVVIAQEVA